MLSDRGDPIPADVWRRFASDTMIDLVNECIIARDGSFIDLRTSSVVLADGREWRGVRIYPATRH